MREWLRDAWAPLYLLSFSLAAFFLFLYGFFPLKYSSGKIADWDDMPTFINEVSIDGQMAYNPGETSVVLMVIDALRHDFVNEHTMPFTASLLENKSACGYVARAEAPTVTMPRIKSPQRKVEKAQWRRTINFWRDIYAMMTGAVSTFADVALNFGAPAVTGDSVVRAAAARGRRNYLFGDETWLRLFPGLWAVEDGTKSFYVADYVEVDNNVTRHLNETLTAVKDGNPAFDFMVLHYLGLDHIGHLEGAHSSKIGPKLKEMDDVVKQIFTAMGTWSRAGALLVCGDHGMRDAGGHGGSSRDELLVPLFLIRTDFRCPHQSNPAATVAQTDLAPSIAYLLRSPFPGDSIGRVLEALMPADPIQHLYLLHYNTLYNARALQAVLGSKSEEMEYYKDFRRAEEQFAQFISNGNKRLATRAADNYKMALEEMSKLLEESHAEFDVFAIVVALVALFMALTAAFFVSLHSLRRIDIVSHRSHINLAAFAVTYAVLLATLTLGCAVSETSSKLCYAHALWTPLVAALVMAAAYVFCVAKSGLESSVDWTVFQNFSWIDGLLIVGSFAHGLSFVGTSFIEEEHQTWYFLWNTLELCVLVRAAGALVSYLSNRSRGATELQDKPEVAALAGHLSTKLLPCWLFIIALHRFLRTLNQTGDRWAFLPDTADWLNLPANSEPLYALMACSMTMTFVICQSNLRHTNNIFQINSALTIVAMASIVAYQMTTKAIPMLHHSMATWDTYHIVNVFLGLVGSQFVLESLSFLGAYRQFCADTWCRHEEKGLLLKDGAAFVYKRRKQKMEDYEGLVQNTEEDRTSLEEVKLKYARSLSYVLLNSLMMSVTLLSRPHNLVLVPSAYLTCVLVGRGVTHQMLRASVAVKRSDALDVVSKTIAHYWVGEVFFFYQGNSNSMASVDLNAGYVGLREYSAAEVAARITLHTYAGPIMATTVLLCSLTRLHSWKEYRRALFIAVSVQALQRIYELAVYSCIAFGFRSHLFVWSVFSPKLIYEATASVVALALAAAPAVGVGAAGLVNWLAGGIAGSN